MGQVRHGCATTTHAIRAAIQRSQASTAALSRELGINPKTVAKWRKRETVADRLCCTNGMRDSLFESSGVATLHEQLVPYEVQNQKLAFVQHGAEEARFAIDLV